MLDAIEPNDLLAAVKAWQPDPQCLSAGDDHALLAVRCWAAAGLCDQQIVQRMFDLVVVSTEIDTAPDDVPIALARHCAAMGLSRNQIIAVLAYLAARVPLWPAADDIAEIAIAAVRECSA
jgi:hypothetical protein